MMWRKIRYNKKSSKELGWFPSWLEATDFNRDLIEKIIQFQESHSLKPDGYVGTNTFRRLKLWHELQENTDQSPNKILVNGELKSIGWHRVKRDFLPSSCYKTSRKERKPHVIVTHWDVCTSADSCKRVLEKRNISTHFVIDNDGTIVQLVDPNDVAWHARGANNVGIGIDISSAYYTKYFNTYTKKGFGPRPLLSNSVVHNRRLPTHLGYYPVQIQAYTALVRFLCSTYDIPLDYPKDENGFLCTTIYKPAIENKFKGIVNHYNLTKNKIDTAGLKLDEIVDSIKELEA